MKKYIILIISIVSGVLFVSTWITCTYFDAKEAALFGGEPDGPVAIFIDDYGTIFKAYLNHPDLSPLEIYYPGDGNPNNPMAIDMNTQEKKIFWSSYDNFNNVYRIQWIHYNTMGKLESNDVNQIFSSDLEINSLFYEKNINQLFFPLDDDIMRIPADVINGTPSLVFDLHADMQYITDILLVPVGVGFDICYTDLTLSYFRIYLSDPFQIPTFEDVFTIAGGTPMPAEIHKILLRPYDSSLIFVENINASTQAIFSIPLEQANPTAIVVKDNTECFDVKTILNDPSGEVLYWIYENGYGSADIPYRGIARTPAHGSEPVEYLISFDSYENVNIGNGRYVLAIDFAGE